MSKIFADIKEVHAYIDDVLLITNGDWDSHLQILMKFWADSNMQDLRSMHRNPFLVAKNLST
eukprot:2173832-Ditylum_brightwellii.AAC.1